ncbi:unnamed protein product [Rotaria sp. Silwood1]|nr:unnamed protein product [Rotaria sp. Silwood1]CAF3857395.1 unnamed protein product [Rotaria sp. Silwood1]
MPDDGYYKGGRFTFSFTIGPEYPYVPPKVKCTQKIYHPNIDLEGNNPNPYDPLNKEAADVLKSNASTFEDHVQKTMAGGTLNGIHFDCVLIQ